MSYVYIKSEPQLWTAGFYDPDGNWEPESDHSSSEAAAKRVAWLNGSETASQQTLKAGGTNDADHIGGGR